MGLDENNDRFSFAPAWADYDEDGWPDLFVAERLRPQEPLPQRGRRRTGKARFKDVAAPAGVEDYGAGMSATFAGLRQRRAPRHLRGQHVDRGRAARDGAARLHARRAAGDPGDLPAPCPRQLALPQPGRRHVRGRHAQGGRRVRPLGLVVRRARLRQRRLGGPLRRQRHVHARGDEPSVDVDSFFWRQVVAQSPLDRKAGNAVRRRLARHQPAS